MENNAMFQQREGIKSDAGKNHLIMI